MTPNEPLSNRIYRGLLRMLPFDFRDDFGPEMERVFAEQRARAERHGRIGLVRLWWDTFAGIFQTAPREHLAMLRQDMKYALRMMRYNPGYTIAAILTLALGIGASTSIFSVIDGILLKPLPYRQGHQLMILHQRAQKANVQDMGFSVQEINDYRQQNKSFSELVEYHNMTFTLFTGAGAERVRAGVVSPGFFEMFGVRPIMGRTFLTSDDHPGAPPVLILSYEYWKQHQGGNSSIVGTVFKMNDKPHIVVGVLPPVPQYPDENDVYMPTSACPFRGSPRAITNRNFRLMSLFGRLKPGASTESAHADMAVIAKRLERAYPASYTKAMGFTAAVGRLQEELTHQARPTLLVLLAAAAFVLLIACANVANLTLARMARRERELLVRSALGAGKARLLRQLVTESLMMGVLAAAVGWLFATESVKLLVEFASRLTPRAREIQIDGSVLAFTVAAVLLTSIVFGSISALYSRDDLTSGLKEGNTQSTVGRRRQRARNALIVCQVAFSFVLLIGAGLMLRSLTKLQQVDPGFVPQRVLAMNINLNWSKYHDSSQYRAVSNRLLAKISSQPGVMSAAISSSFPLENVGDPTLRTLEIEGRVARDTEAAPAASIRIATPEYFRTLGIPLLRGRTFTSADNEKALPVAIVNQALADRYWKGDDPLGKRIKFGTQDWLRIAGVVGDVREFGLERQPREEVYVPNAQFPNPSVILVRTAGEPLSAAQQLRRAVLEEDPETAIPAVQTLEQVRGDTLKSPRVMTDLLGIFAALALIVAAAGIGGIVALSVSQRIHEIGIRMALGAKPGGVFAGIVRQGMLLVAIGVGVGWMGALAFSRLLKGLLFEVQPADPVTFAGVSLLFALTAFAACAIPARRATKVDPLIALRQE